MLEEDGVRLLGEATGGSPAVTACVGTTGIEGVSAVTTSRFGPAQLVLAMELPQSL